MSTAGALPAGGARTAAERAESIIQTAAGTPKPLDAFARTLTRITGIERLTTTIYGTGARTEEGRARQRAALRAWRAATKAAAK